MASDQFTYVPFVDFLFSSVDNPAHDAFHRRMSDLQSDLLVVLDNFPKVHPDRLNEEFRRLFDAIAELCPASASRTAALRSCLLAKMCAVKAMYYMEGPYRGYSPMFNQMAHFHLQAAILQANFAISHDGRF